MSKLRVMAAGSKYNLASVPESSWQPENINVVSGVSLTNTWLTLYTYSWLVSRSTFASFHERQPSIRRSRWTSTGALWGKCMDAVFPFKYGNYFPVSHLPSWAAEFRALPKNAHVTPSNTNIIALHRQVDLKEATFLFYSYEKNITLQFLKAPPRCHLFHLVHWT